MTSKLAPQTAKADIITIGCEDQLQKRNTLKGLAFQKLVRFVMGTSDEDCSVKRIFEQLTKQQSEYFIVNKQFKAQGKGFYRKWKYLHISDFDDYLEIWEREQIIDKTWKVCSFCGQKIRAEKQFSRKCWKCKKGRFQLQSEKKDNWVLKVKGARNRVLKFLLEYDYLKLAQLRKRLDFFHYANGVFSIYEAKNKEKSGLSFRDLRKTLIYPFIISRCNFPVEKLVLIYNGKITAELKNKVRKGYGEDFPFHIELLPIRLFLMQKAVNVKAIKVEKIAENYEYTIIPGYSRKIIIDLTEVE